MSSHNAPVTEQMDDPESGWTWFLSLASIVIFIVTVVAIVAMFYAFEDNEVKNKVIDVPAREFTELRTEQEGLLDEYGRYSVIPMGGSEADAESRIRIPVEQAMEVLVAESKNNQARDTGGDASEQLARSATPVEGTEVGER